MATTLSSTLYPPIIDTFMPAFVCQGDTITTEDVITTRVYFSISSYNTENSIKKVHVTVNNQNTNITALDKSKYPAGIKVSNLLVDNERETDDKYYIEISNNDLTDEKFNINQFYKVQLRFSKADFDNPLNNQTIQNNLNQFSEWSTGCLIRGISQPVVILKNLGSGSNQKDTFDSIGSTKIYLNNLSECIGSLSFENEEETEILSSYRIRVFNQDANILLDTPIEDSGIIYTDSYNSNAIYYVFKHNFEDASNYTLHFDYQTNNEYSAQIEFNFRILLQTIEDDLQPDVFKADFITNAAAGTILVRLSSPLQEDKSPQGTFILKRTSSKSNYSKWDEIHNIITDNLYSYTWVDYTVESGILYKYAIQKVNSAGIRGVLRILNNEPVGVILDDMFLGNNGKLLKIAFNPQVSNYKRNILETKNDTIGSKYPYISKTGAIGYREFQLSGLISYHSDIYEDFDCNFIDSFMPYKEEESLDNKNPNREFIKDDIELYGGGLEDYQKFNQNNNINKYNDFTYERLFREKVLEYLQDTTVKLFRSPSEGNILVKLMNVSLTPQQALGRMIYDFSATAYEMDDCNVDNYIKYNIISKETFTYKLDTYKDHIGQVVVNAEETTGEINILDIIKKKFSQQEVEGIKKNVKYLKWVHFDFSESIPTSFSNISGHLIKINEQEIIIPSGTKSYDIYGVDINSISYKHISPGTTYIDYIAYIQNININRNIIKDQYSLRIGQMIDTFEYKQSIVSLIKSKYLIDTPSLKQELISLNRLRISAPAGTVAYIKNFNVSNSNLSDQGYYKHIIWDKGFLELYDEELIIEDFYFTGIKLRPAIDPNNPQPNEWVDETETKYDFLADIPLKDRKNQRVYQLNSFAIGGDGNVSIDESGNIVLTGVTENIDNGDNGDITSADGKVYLAKITDPSTTLSDNLGLRIQDNEGNEQAHNFYSLVVERIAPGPTDNRYIWIAEGDSGYWEEFTEDMEIKCPVKAEIDYYYEIERKEYSD